MKQFFTQIELLFLATMMSVSVISGITLLLYITTIELFGEKEELVILFFAAIASIGVPVQPQLNRVMSEFSAQK